MADEVILDIPESSDLTSGAYAIVDRLYDEQDTPLHVLLILTGALVTAARECGQDDEETREMLRCFMSDNPPTGATAKH